MKSIDSASQGSRSQPGVQLTAHTGHGQPLSSTDMSVHVLPARSQCARTARWSRQSKPTSAPLESGIACARAGYAQFERVSMHMCMTGNITSVVRTEALYQCCDSVSMPSCPMDTMNINQQASLRK